MDMAGCDPVKFICVCLLGLTALGGRTGDAHAQIDVAISWGVLSNYADGGFRSELTFINEGLEPFPDTGWTLYFNFIRRVRPESVPPSIEITRINGNFYKLEPTEAFSPIPPGRRRTFRFDASAWAIKLTDAPSGFYFVFADSLGRPLPPQPVAEVAIQPFVSEHQTNRSRNDATPVPTAALRYRRNAQLTLIEPEMLGRIVPTPVRVDAAEGQVVLDEHTTIHYADGLGGESAFLAAALRPLLGAVPVVEAGGEGGASDIVLRLGAVAVDGSSPEAYRLTIDPEEGIEIAGNSPDGVFYGIQSLRALAPLEAYREPVESLRLKAVTVTDAPHFSYRGQHLDVARNFQPVSAVKKLLDLMAFYKLNTFHFHLTDDEGWRLAIEELPELAEVGGRRGHTLTEQDMLIPSYGSGPFPDPQTSSGSGYYSRAEFIDLLKYAHERHIEVIPEIDVPGHARAAIVAMEARYDRLMAQGQPEAAARYRLIDPDDTSTYESIQGWAGNVIDVCRESTYRFMETVIDDIVEMYDESGVPLESIHVGGDEVAHGAWVESPSCEALLEQSEELEVPGDLPDYFLGRVNEMLLERGLITGGWQEVAFDDVRRDGRAVSVADPFFADKDVRPYVWANIWGSGTEDYAYKLANAGYPVVMSQSTTFYFDMAWNKHPDEPGFYWADFVDARDPWEFLPFDLYENAEVNAWGHPISDSAYADAVQLTDEGRANILGLQGQLWAETVKSPQRLEYMIAPRIISLAERAWAKQPEWATIEDDTDRERLADIQWNSFANELGRRELPRLDHLFGVYGYRLPPPGAIIEDGLLKANVAFPGLTIRYTSDGTTPTAQSPRYTDAVRIEDVEVVQLRTFSTTGRGSRVVAVRR